MANCPWLGAEAHGAPMSLLNLLAEVATEKLLTDPTVQMLNSSKPVAVTFEPQVKSEIRVQEHKGKPLSLLQVSTMSDSNLLKYFSLNQANELKKKFYYTCQFLPETCEQMTQSFGNEVKARNEMKKHLRGHLRALLHVNNTSSSQENYILYSVSKQKCVALPLEAAGKRKFKGTGSEKENSVSHHFRLSKLYGSIKETESKSALKLIRPISSTNELNSNQKIFNSNCDNNMFRSHTKKPVSQSCNEKEENLGTMNSYHNDENNHSDYSNLESSCPNDCFSITPHSSAINSYPVVDGAINTTKCNKAFNLSSHSIETYTQTIGKSERVSKSGADDDKPHKNYTIVSHDHGYVGHIKTSKSLMTDANFIQDDPETKEMAASQSTQPPLVGSELMFKKIKMEMDEDDPISDTEKEKRMRGKGKVIGQSKVEKEMALDLINQMKSQPLILLDTLECNICNPPRVFTALSTLISHYKSHAGIRPYVCSLCQSVFTRQHSLNYHMLIHSNQTRFTCDDCGRKFRHPSHFKEHRRRHTGESPYGCEDCSMRFKTRNTYKRHLRTRHGKVLNIHGGVKRVNELDLVSCVKKRKSADESNLSNISEYNSKFSYESESDSKLAYDSQSELKLLHESSHSKQLHEDNVLPMIPKGSMEDSSKACDFQLSAAEAIVPYFVQPKGVTETEFESSGSIITDDAISEHIEVESSNCFDHSLCLCCDNVKNGHHFHESLKNDLHFNHESRKNHYSAKTVSALGHSRARDEPKMSCSAPSLVRSRSDALVNTIEAVVNMRQYVNSLPSNSHYSRLSDKFSEASTTNPMNTEPSPGRIANLDCYSGFQKPSKVDSDKWTNLMTEVLSLSSAVNKGRKLKEFSVNPYDLVNRSSSPYMNTEKAANGNLANSRKMKQISIQNKFVNGTNTSMVVEADIAATVNAFGQNLAQEIPQGSSEHQKHTEVSSRYITMVTTYDQSATSEEVSEFSTCRPVEGKFTRSHLNSDKSSLIILPVEKMSASQNSVESNCPVNSLEPRKDVLVIRCVQMDDGQHSKLNSPQCSVPFPLGQLVAVDNQCIRPGGGMDAKSQATMKPVCKVDPIQISRNNVIRKRVKDCCNDRVSSNTSRKLSLSSHVDNIQAIDLSSSMNDSIESTSIRSLMQPNCIVSNVALSSTGIRKDTVTDNRNIPVSSNSSGMVLVIKPLIRKSDRRNDNPKVSPKCDGVTMSSGSKGGESVTLNFSRTEEHHPGTLILNSGTINQINDSSNGSQFCKNNSLECINSAQNLNLPLKAIPVTSDSSLTRTVNPRPNHPSIKPGRPTGILNHLLMSDKSISCGDLYYSQYNNLIRNVNQDEEGSRFLDCKVKNQVQLS